MIAYTSSGGKSPKISRSRCTRACAITFLSNESSASLFSIVLSTLHPTGWHFRPCLLAPLLAGSSLVITPTATLTEHALLSQRFTDAQKTAFPCRLRLKNRNSTCAYLVNTLK